MKEKKKSKETNVMTKKKRKTKMVLKVNRRKKYIDTGSFTPNATKKIDISLLLGKLV